MAIVIYYPEKENRVTGRGFVVNDKQVYLNPGVNDVSDLSYADFVKNAVLQQLVTIGAVVLPSVPPSTASSVGYDSVLAKFPSLVSFWDFSQSSEPYYSYYPENSYPLINGDTGVVQSVLDSNSLSGRCIYINGLDTALKIPSAEIGDLNIAAKSDQVTMIVYLKISTDVGYICGTWGEKDADARRQYGLFTGLGFYGGAGKFCCHISENGSDSPNLIYSRDLAANNSNIKLDEWYWVALRYQPGAIRCFYKNRFEARPTFTEANNPPIAEGLTYSKNPYIFPDGLFNLIPEDFTVGANYIQGEEGFANPMTGYVGAIAVFNRCLSQSEILKFTTLKSGGTPIFYNFSNRLLDGTNNNVGINSYRSLRGVNGTEDSNTTFVTTHGWGLSFNGGIYYITKNFSSTGISFWFDNQYYNIPVKSLASFSLLLNNASSVDLIHFCIRVDGIWYASSEPFSMSVNGAVATNWATAETKTLKFFRNKIKWRLLNVVPDTTLVLNSTSPAIIPENGYLESVGILSPTTPTGVIRLTNIAVNTSDDWIPKPLISPTNTVKPAITGTLTVGSILTCSTGTWNNATAGAYSYRWKRNGITISGAFNATYTLVGADSGTQISCFVIAANNETNYAVLSNVVTIA